LEIKFSPRLGHIKLF